jgi:hypothetical protein
MSSNYKNLYDTCLTEVQYTQTQKIKVEKCDPEFFFKNIRQVCNDRFLIFNEFFKYF